jgi:hypothetical protein
MQNTHRRFWKLNNYEYGLTWAQFWSSSSDAQIDCKSNIVGEYTFYADNAYYSPTGQQDDRRETLSRLGYREVLHPHFDGIDVVIRMWPSSVNYTKVYQDRRMLVNNIPGIEVLDRKNDLERLLQQFTERCRHRNAQEIADGSCLDSDSFFLPTFDIATPAGCADWVRSSIVQNPATGLLLRPAWLHKPPVAYSGAGLHLVNAAALGPLSVPASHTQDTGDPWDHALQKRAADQCASVLVELKAAGTNLLEPGERGSVDIHGLPVPQMPEVVLQEYLTRVMKFRGRKFSIRHFVLILSVNPPVMLGHPGRITVCQDPYNDTDIGAGPLSSLEAGSRRWQHVSHTGGHPQYSEFLAECERSGECNIPGFYSYAHWASEHGKEVVTRAIARAKAIESFAFRSALDHLRRWAEHPGTFQLMAVDFGIEPNGRLVLHEFNVAPELSTGAPDIPIFETTIRMAREAQALRLVGKSIVRNPPAGEGGATNFEVISPWEPVCIGSGLAMYTTTKDGGTMVEQQCDLFDARKRRNDERCE